MIQEALTGRISRRGMFTSLDGATVAPVHFNHAGHAKGGRQGVIVRIGPREYFGIHRDASNVVKLYRKRGRK